MTSIKELAKWLKKSVQFLKDDENYVGTWKTLDQTFCAVVLWEEGWGEKERDDVIQFPEDKDWGLCAGIKIYNKDETVDMWIYPWDKESGDLLTESTGIAPKEDYEQMASWILGEYDKLKSFVPAEDGSVSPESVPPEELTAMIEPEEGADEVEIDSVEMEPDMEPSVSPEELRAEEPVEESVIDDAESVMIPGEAWYGEFPILTQSIYEFLGEHGIFPDNGYIDKSDTAGSDLTLKLTLTGDLKHDHLKVEDLVDEWCGEENLAIVSHDKQDIGQSDEDWFEAEHIWKLKRMPINSPDPKIKPEIIEPEDEIEA